MQKPSKSEAEAERVNKNLAAAKKNYQAPGSQTSFAQQKRNAWNNYRAYFEPAMTKYRQNIFDAVLDLGRADGATIRKILKRIVKLNNDYEQGCINAMSEYLHIFTTVHTQESLDNRGIQMDKMLKMAKDYESTKSVPKPKRIIRDRKDVKVMSKVNKVSTKPKKRSKKK